MSISKLLFTNLSVISDNILDPDLISVFVSDDGKYYQCVKEERIIAKQGKEPSVSQHGLPTLNLQRHVLLRFKQMLLYQRPLLLFLGCLLVR